MATKKGETAAQAREREAKKALERVERDAEVIGQSSLVRAAEKVRGHMSGADANPDDPVEIWGKRVGRILSVIAFIGLAIWLIGYLMR